jgi:hypothetical protein
MRRRLCRRSQALQLPHLVAFALLALARFELLHPHQPASGGTGRGSSDAPCSSSLAVAGALQDVQHLHMATQLAAAVPLPPPLSSGASSARVLQGVGDHFASTASLISPSLQGEARAEPPGTWALPSPP